MSLFGDIGNIFHSIGHFFTGGDNSTQSQQQAQQPSWHAPMAMPSQPQQSNTNNTQWHAPMALPQKAQPQQQQPAQPQPVTPPQNTIQLYQGQHTPQAGSFDSNAPLVKAANNGTGNYNPTPFNQQLAAEQAANNGPSSTTDRVINTAGDSIARTIIGIPQGIAQLYDMATPGKGTNRVTKALDNMGADVDKDQQQNGIQGQTGSDIYHGLQVAENVLPGAIGAVSKVSDLVKAGANAGDIARAGVDAVTAAPKKIVSTVKTIGDHVGPMMDDTTLIAPQKAPEVAPGLTPGPGAQATAHLPETTDVPGNTAAIGNRSTTPVAPAEMPAPTIAPVPARTATAPTQPTTELPETQSPPLHTPENISSEPPVMQNNVAQTPNTVNTADNAPNVRAEYEKQLAKAGATEDALNPTATKTQKVLGNVKQHDVLSNDELNQAANRVTATKSDDELVTTYGKGAKIEKAADLAEANAALPRLAKMATEAAQNGVKAENNDALKAISNILDGAEAHVSGSGRSLNYAGSMYDSMPKEAKTEYLIKSLNKSRTANGLPELSDEEENAARDEINHLLGITENYDTAANAAQGEAEKIKAQIGSGQLTQDDVQKIDEYKQIANQNTMAAEKTQGDVARAYSKYAPERFTVTGAGDRAGELARSLMLTRPTGRLSDVATTSMNVVHSLTQNAVEAAIGKVAEAKRAMLGQTPGKYITQAPSADALLQGTAEGLQKAGGNYRGDSFVGDVRKAIKSGSEGGQAQLRRAGASGWTHPINTVRNLSHAMAETATNLSQGVKNTRILQEAYKEADAKGLTGIDRDVYAHSTAAFPSKAMEANGQRLLDEVNNMNKNPFSDGLTAMSKAFDKVPVFGEQIRNLVTPFNQWVGAQAWNGVTDKNVVANVIKMGRAIIKGDSQEAMHQAAGLIVNGGTIGAGYGLANAGVLTTHNASGYNDDGLYLHLGGHYIPIGFFGFAAPSIIMGWAAHEGMKDNTPNKSVTQKILDAANNAFTTTAHAYLGNTTLGGNNEFIKDMQNTIQGKQGSSWADVGATALTDAAGSYVPGIAGDINTVLNHSPLNPTGEAALTKATKGEAGQVDPKTGNPSTAKDVIKTDLNRLLNKIPGVSQLMFPRNPGEAAPDLGSSITRGDNGSAEQENNNKVIDALPKPEQQPVRTQLIKNSGENQVLAQKAADAITGPAKVNAQQIADQMKFAGQNGAIDNAVAGAKQSAAEREFTKNGGTQAQQVGNKWGAMIDGKPQYFDNQQKAQDAVDMAHFKDSHQDSATYNGKYYIMDANGNPHVYASQLQAQQANDLSDFQNGKRTDFGKNVNGRVYEQGSDGKITPMDTKDYDYRNAVNDIANAKASGDLNGIQKGQQDLLGNIQWQLNHAQLTDENRSHLIDTAAKTQAEYNKYKLWGDTSQPKGAPSYQMEFGGGNDKSSAYIKSIKELGVKYGLDVNALLGVATAEGLGGGVGDGGHAFGPFQMNDAGGVLSGRFSSPQEAQKYAESPQGIEEAIQNIAKVAKGKIGPDAIAAIISEYERPADYAAGLAKGLSPLEAAKQTRDYQVAMGAYTGDNKVNLPTTPDGLVTGSSGDTSLVSDSTAAQNAANLVRQNKVGSLPTLQRENFINDLATKPIALNIPQVKLTDPETLIKAHKITVGMPKA